MIWRYFMGFEQIKSLSGILNGENLFDLRVDWLTSSVTGWIKIIFQRIIVLYKLLQDRLVQQNLGYFHGSVQMQVATSRNRIKTRQITSRSMGP